MRVGLKAAKFFVGSFVPFVGGGRYLLQEVEIKIFMVLAIWRRSRQGHGWILSLGRGARFASSREFAFMR
jgi:hypothetical protein